MKINKRRISVGCLEIGKRERKGIKEVLDSGRISEGVKTCELEKKWARFVGTKYCVATSSGTAALITALTALKYLYKLEKRPKIITTPLTYVSVVNAIVLTGFEPVFVDIDPLTFCIKPDAI
ncbi:MAG: aminotransferase class I/II-fold pyridoxal phosphate-dependent enzyme, partial [Candidatus Omnitrophica bacterium]|nr:aminotransferase class I/II-fold pyridoxal phosphate-dependent enzyme [Candidatus Omnitrophota bacterium]